MDQHAADRRQYFRLAFSDLAGTLEVFEVDLQPVSGEPLPVLIVNLGGGGLHLCTQADIPADRGVFATIAFALNGRPFVFRGEFIWRTDDPDCRRYGIRFVDLDEREQGALVTLLGRIQIERSRSPAGAK